MYRDHNCGELTIKNVGEKVTLAGWVQRIRNLGSMKFIDLRDEFGITQIVINDEELKQLVKEFEKRNIHPDVIVIDPPRKGLDLESIEYIIKFRPKKIGYVSCSPATLARDLKLLSTYYDIGKVVPVDLFPNSVHCEVVTNLELKK